MLTLQQFNDRFCDEEACREFVFQNRWPKGFVCPICLHTKHKFNEKRNLYQCGECRAQTSLTSGTFLHGTKLPIRFWFLAMYYIAYSEGCSANELANTLRVNYRTGLRILRIVREAMRCWNGNHPFSNFVEWSQQKTADEEGAVGTRESATVAEAGGGASTSNAEAKALVGRAVRVLAQKAKRFVTLKYRKVSDRYLQSYLDEYYFRRLRRFDDDRALNFLMCAMASIRHIPMMHVHLNEKNRTSLPLAPFGELPLGLIK